MRFKAGFLISEISFGHVDIAAENLGRASLSRAIFHAGDFSIYYYNLKKSV